MRTFASSILAVALAVAALAAPAPAAAAPDEPDAQQLFREGNQAYFKGEYAMAARLYGQILEDFELEDPVLYHNLGNAFFRTGDYGSAILYYRRGLRLDPEGDVEEALRGNLEVTRQVLQERYRTGSDKSQFIYAEPGGLVYRMTHLVSAGTPAVVFLVAWWLLWLLLAARRLLPARRGLGAAAIPVAVVTLLLAGVAAGRAWTDDHFRLGVVVEDRVTLREGRHADARGIDIPEGMEVRIVDPGDDWTRVELANGREGWVETGAVKQI
ncbi:MAG: tetratricopeptide repeat protein [Myxococcota bacterium]